MSSSHSGFVVRVKEDDAAHALFTPARVGGLAHLRTLRGSPLNWDHVAWLASGPIEGVTAVRRRSIGSDDRYDLVVTDSGWAAHYHRRPRERFGWYGPTRFLSGVRGQPALLEIGLPGLERLEALLPHSSRGIVHARFAPLLGWRRVGVFGTELGRADAAALLETNAALGWQSHAVIRVGARLMHFVHRPWPFEGWTSATELPPTSVSGNPAVMQSRFGDRGNFELLVPTQSGGVEHWWRDNDAAGDRWTRAASFAAGDVLATSIFQKDGENDVRLEAVLRYRDHVEHWQRTDSGAWQQAGTPYVDPAENGPVRGIWRIPYSTDVVGAHAALLPNGRVLLFGLAEDDDPNTGSDLLPAESCVFDPQTFEEWRPDVEKNVFCGGQCFTADGELLVAGGHGLPSHVRAMHLYKPGCQAGEWLEKPPLERGRWYPTCTLLPDGLPGTSGGGVFILSGSVRAGPWDGENSNKTYEIYNPTGALSAPADAPIIGKAGDFALYPFVHVLPNRRLFVHAGRRTSFFDVDGLTWSDQPFLTVSPHPRNYPIQGACVLLPLLPPDYRVRILLIGGGTLNADGHPHEDNPASRDCEVLDIGTAPLAWRPLPPMAEARVMPDAVLLPDGKVFVTSGSSHGVADQRMTPVFTTELFDPVNNLWTTLAESRIPRLYHSTALLLPDARVMTAGKDSQYNPAPHNYPERRLEMFSPPYLFAGPRPQIGTLATPALRYGQDFVVPTPDAGGVARAALMRPGAVTHSFNMDQRYVGLEVTAVAADRLTLRAPPNSSIAPRGPYMLFLISTSGVPSNGEIVHVSGS